MAEGGAMSADPLGVPDVVVVVGAVVALGAAHAAQRRVVGPRSACYRALPRHAQYEWDGRALNLAFQPLQAAFNAHVLLACAATRRDPLYGYDRAAHAGFLAILAFYLYDTVLCVAHEPGEYVAGWVVHHVFAAAMLTWLTAVQRTSAMPAAVFLVSAAGHIGNEARWFLRTSGRMTTPINNAVGVLCNILFFATSVVPPPYFVYAAALHRRVSCSEMLLRRMMWPCIATFSLIWGVHVILFAVQVKRTVRHWSGHTLHTQPKKQQ